MDGTWSEWTDYTKCSQTCIGGVQQRTRSCSEPQFGGKPCEGEDLQTLECPPPGILNLLFRAIDIPCISIYSSHVIILHN